jgi:5-hydroxyisourate hydrolase-like protein (transthyretin family)
MRSEAMIAEPHMKLHVLDNIAGSAAALVVVDLAVAKDFERGVACM